MFDFLKKSFKLVAPISGKTIDLSEVPDPVFSQRLAGDGIAIIPTGDVIVAPADGKLTLIFRTNHAVGMTLENGIEIIVHIGLDTVELKGEGFERIAEEGQNIKAGEPIIKIDRELIKAKGRSLITPVLIANPTEASEIKYNTGLTVEAGKDVIITYAKE